MINELFIKLVKVTGWRGWAEWACCWRGCDKNNVTPTWTCHNDDAGGGEADGLPIRLPTLSLTLHVLAAGGWWLFFSTPASWKMKCKTKSNILLCHGGTHTHSTTHKKERKRIFINWV